MQFPNWFDSYARGYFAAHLTALAGAPGLRFLQVGAFTGDASEWLLDRVLTGEGSVLVDVDTWHGSDEPEHDRLDFTEVERAYDERMAEAAVAGRLVKFKGTSADYFATQREPFDFIYIDGDHTAFGVLSDAVSAVRVLKPGGLLAFDDYLWKSGKTRFHEPAVAIDAIADVCGDRLRRTDSGLQVWFRKVGQ